MSSNLKVSGNTWEMTVQKAGLVGSLSKETFFLSNDSNSDKLNLKENGLPKGQLIDEQIEKM